MRLIHKNQKGFTLIELLVALVVTGLIAGGITMTALQVINGSTRSNNHMTAVKQAQNAGYWISHDAQMAQDVALGPGDTGFPLVLTWTDWDGNANTVTYTLDSSELWRDDGQQQTLVAQYINPTQTSCQFMFGVFTFTITASVGGDWQEASETRVYKIVPRPGI